MNSCILEVKCQLCDDLEACGADVLLTPLTAGASVSWSTLTGSFIRRAGSSVLTVTGEGAVKAPVPCSAQTVTVYTCSHTHTHTKSSYFLV